MPKTLLTQTAIAALKARDKPYAVPTGVPNLRVHVSPKGTKTFQLRRNGTMITLGRCDQVALPEARRIAITDETPEAVAKATRTIGEWIKLYEDDKANLVSCRSRGASLRLVLRELLKREVAALTKPWLERRFAELAGTYKPRTLKTYRTTVVMLVNYIMENDGLEKTPFRRLSPIPVDKLYKRLEPGDIGRVTEWCYNATTTTDLRLACFTMIGLHTGMRPGEILSLQRSEIRLLDKPPHIRLLAGKTKTSEYRTVRMTHTLRMFLIERFEELTERDPFKIRDYGRPFKRMMAEAQVQSPVTPHGLRHTAGYVMASEGIPITTIMDMLGHKSVDMTSIYTQANRKDFQDAAAALDAALSEAHRRSRRTMDEVIAEALEDFRKGEM